MTTYSLKNLLKLRQKNLDEAQIFLTITKKNLYLQQQKLKTIQTQINDSFQENRSFKHSFALDHVYQDKTVEKYLFFDSLNKVKEIQRQKMLLMLAEQENALSMAQQKYHRALNEVITKKQKLKVVRKHKSKWEALVKREKESRQDHENDDTNTILFFRQKIR